MITIWKYPLAVTDNQEISLPVGANLLTIQLQNGRPCLWALVNTGAAQKRVRIQIRGTGHPADDVGRYIATFQLGPLVFHCFAEEA